MAYAWYSEHQDKLTGHCLYKTLDGITVKVTEIVSHKEIKPCSKWNDLIYLGEVNECIKGNSFYSTQNSLPIEKQLNNLYKLYNEMTKTENSCKKQFKKTNICFCFKCPIKRIIN